IGAFQPMPGDARRTAVWLGRRPPVRGPVDRDPDPQPASATIASTIIGIRRTTGTVAPTHRMRRIYPGRNGQDTMRTRALPIRLSAILFVLVGALLASSGAASAAAKTVHH